MSSFVQTTSNGVFKDQLAKFLTRVVRCALSEGYVNKQCLVLVGTKQNSGKTTFLRFLCPPELKQYYTENISTDKDGSIALATRFLLNADEFATFTRVDTNILKAFISKDSVNVRLPYARKAERMERIGSFVASTNRTDFLNDVTGSVRFLVFELEHIDFAYSHEVDINQVWAQAHYNAFERENYKYEMTPKELEENEKRNEKFRQLTLEEELIREHFEDSANVIDGFLTATEVMLAMGDAFGVRMNNVRIGRAMTSLKYEKVKHPQKQVYGYLVKRKK